MNTDFIVPTWIIEDIIDFFQPYGKVVNVYKENDKIFKNLLDCDKIKNEKYFPDVDNQYDWLIDILSQSINSDIIKYFNNVFSNILLILPLSKLYDNLSLLKLNKNIKHIRTYSKNIENKLNEPICVIHFKQNYFKNISYSTFK
jgi:hypothetical protein